jgi:3-dehydroquinate dehydratase-2
MGERTVVVLNGPNLNLLGEREPEVYGHETLADVEALCGQAAADAGLGLDFRQSNHEGVLVDAIHEVRTSAAGIVINAGALTHTSIALRDAISAIKIPVIEVHISNIHNREDFRTRSLTAGVCAGQISGLGFLSYEVGIMPWCAC